jgi:hypothetical protein
MPEANLERQGRLNRLLGWTVAASLCIAALTAIAAILSGDFDDTDGRVIASSVVFGISTAVAGSGAALRQRASVALRVLGLATMVLTAASFVLFLVALWSEMDGDEPWRWFGCVGFAALAASHASLVCGALRPTDSEVVRTLASSSIVLAVVDATVAILFVGEVIDEVDDQSAQVVAVLVVLLVLTSALQPIVRRLQQSRPAASREARGGLVTEVLAAADRIEALNADPARRSAEIRRECEGLRDLARSHDA